MRKVLVCTPDFYGIEYEINPWMSRSRKADSALAMSQWRGLNDTLQSLGCQISLITPQPKLPDMVFTANAGLVVGQDVVLPEGCPGSCTALAERGYRTHALPMTEFIKAGGACKCIVLFLPQRGIPARNLFP